MGCIVYNPHWLQSLHQLLSGVFLYTYTGVGLSVLLVSTCRAMREPQFVERVTELAPRFFVCIPLVKVKQPVKVACRTFLAGNYKQKTINYEST